jgi:hypothetical protein
MTSILFLGIKQFLSENYWLIMYFIVVYIQFLSYIMTGKLLQFNPAEKFSYEDEFNLIVTRLLDEYESHHPFRDPAQWRNPIEQQFRCSIMDFSKNLWEAIKSCGHPDVNNSSDTLAKFIVDNINNWFIENNSEYNSLHNNINKKTFVTAKDILTFLITVCDSSNIPNFLSHEVLSDEEKVQEYLKHLTLRDRYYLLHALWIYYWFDNIARFMMAMEFPMFGVSWKSDTPVRRGIEHRQKFMLVQQPSWNISSLWEKVSGQVKNTIDSNESKE